MKPHSVTFARWLPAAVEGGGILIALGLPLVFNPWARSPFEPVKEAYFRIIVLAMAVAAIGAWIIGPRRPSKMLENPLLIPALLWAGAYVAATLTSINPRTSIQVEGKTVTIFCVVLLLALIGNELRSFSQIDRLVTMVILGSIPTALYGILQFCGLDPLPWVTDSVSPVLSTLGRSNFLGAYLAAVTPFTLWRIIASKEQSRYILVLLIQVICLWLTFARAAWVGFVGGNVLFLALLAHFRKERRFLFATALILMLGTGLFWVMNRFPLPTPDRSPMVEGGWNNPTQFTEWRASSVSARRIIWNTTVTLVQKRWLLGYGPGTFAAIFSDHYPPELRYLDPKTIDNPHNLILETLMDAGLVGLLAFLFLTITFYWTALFSPLRTLGTVQGLQMAAVGSVTVSLIQAQFTPSGIVLEALRALALAIGVAAASPQPDVENVWEPAT